MVEKGCLSYLTYIWDTSAKMPPLELVGVVWEFMDVFPTDLLGVPLDRDTNFGIDLEPGTQPFFGARHSALFHSFFNDGSI